MLFLCVWNYVYSNFFRGMCIFLYVMFYYKIEINKSGMSNKIVELLDIYDN